MLVPGLFYAVILSAYSAVFATPVNMKGVREYALDGHTCPASEKVFETSPESLMVCLATCVSEATCSSVVYKPNWCRGCPNQHLETFGTELMSGAVFYNKVTGLAQYGEDCRLNSCVGENQVCKLNVTAAEYQCDCAIGLVWASIGANPMSCMNLLTLAGDNCRWSACYGNNINCVDDVCECADGPNIKYFPEIGKCEQGTQLYGEDCEYGRCVQDNQTCVEGTCTCDHGYSHSVGDTCVAECNVYGDTYQRFDRWRLLSHIIHQLSPLFLNECHAWCSNNDTCRSISVLYFSSIRIIQLTCYFHDVTSLDVLPFWEYRIDPWRAFSHFVRNCQ